MFIAYVSVDLFRSSVAVHASEYEGIVAPMDTHKVWAIANAERVSQVLALAIRTLYPRGTIKCLARLLDVPIGTAHSIIHKRLPLWRRRELAEKLLQEIYGEIHSHIELCMQLEELTGNRNGGVSAARGGMDAAGDVPDQKIDPLLAAARWLAERAARR
jgi:hypothetical protein